MAIELTEVDGILIIDKAAGMTSHDVVARVRRIFSTKRVGHTGTLDPFATGVLVLLLGKATRLARFLGGDAKEYIAVIQFGFETATGDSTGKQTSDKVALGSGPVDWEAAFTKFRGEIMQTPPMYSAKKIAGKKLYEIAREGGEVTREPIAVNIYELAIIDDSELKEAARLTVRVSCSAGTYVRTLAEDIGRSVGVGAHLTKLRRTAAGQFDLRYAYTLDDLKRSRTPWSKLLPIDRAVAHLAEFTLEDVRIDKTKSGLATRVDGSRFSDGDFVRMTDRDGGLIAIGAYSADDKWVKPKIVLV